MSSSKSMDLHLFEKSNLTQERQEFVLGAAEGEFASLSGTGRGKEKTRPEGGAVNQKKLVTRRLDRNRFGLWSGYPICPAKCKHDAQAHIYELQCEGDDACSP